MDPVVVMLERVGRREKSFEQGEEGGAVDAIEGLKWRTIIAVRQIDHGNVVHWLAG
jgi:hypothetical protein